MRLRSTTSGVLAAMLLCVLSWASACDLSCQLPWLAGQGCCAGKAPASPVNVQVKAQDSDCHDMAGMSASKSASMMASSSADASLHASTQTGTMPCEQTVSVAAVDSDHSFDGAGFVAVTVDAAVAVVYQSETTLHRALAPPGASGFRPLLVSLRV